jgi:hypothetical protein
MSVLKQVIEFLRGEGWKTPNGAGGAGNPVPPLSPEGRHIASRVLHQALAPRHADESHMLFRPIGEDGDVIQRSEEWHRDGAGMKSVEKECHVTTTTGDIVPPKDIRIQCFVCRGYDAVGSHCRCGIALCRRHTFRDPVDGSPLCPTCNAQALELFDTWAAHDRQQTPRQPES